MNDERLSDEAVAPTLLDVVAVLSDTYQDAGVMIWLRARNRQLRDRTGETFSPAQFIDSGRIVEVFEAACRIEGQYLEPPVTVAESVVTALRPLLSLLVPARGHRACAEAESRLCGLLTSERDARRGDRDAIYDGLVVWLEQRAKSFDEDARHLRAKAHSATLPTAVAAALREAITDLGRSE